MPSIPIGSLSLSIGTTRSVRAPANLAIGSLGFSDATSKMWLTCPVSATRSTAGAVPRLTIGVLSLYISETPEARYVPWHVDTHHLRRATWNRTLPRKCVSRFPILHQTQVLVRPRHYL